VRTAVGAMSTVWPLASPRATNAAPIEPVAPGRFSTSTGCPMDCETAGESARGMRSEVLPGGKGTTIVIGRVGKDCASTMAGSTSSSAKRSAAFLRLAIIEILRT
jgi:hypothetical protein